MDIQLQDIIQIHWNKLDAASPRYIVDYISSDKLRLINIDNLEIITIPLDQGVPDTGEKTIVQIDILNRSTKKGYAEQNDLVPGVWINISVNDEPSTKGFIREKDEDMIVVKLVLDVKSLYDTDKWKLPERNDQVESVANWGDSPEEGDDIPQYTSRWGDSPEEGDDYIYIDFKYEGIPDNISVQIIDNPLLIKVDSTNIEYPVDESPIEFDINFNPTSEIIELYQEVEVPEDEKRYDLPVQLADLLDDLLSDIPTELRTREKLNTLNILLDRFKELRYLFSNTDNKGYVSSLKTHDHDYNPVTSALQNLNQSLFWLIPVVKNKRKLYNVDDDKLPDDVILRRLKTYIELENTYQEEYESHNTQNRYRTWLSKQQLLNNEYLLPSLYDPQTKLTINTNLPVVINNEIMGEEAQSSVVGSKGSSASVMTINNATAVYSLPTTYLTNNDVNIKLPRTRQFISDKDSVIVKNFIKLNKLAIAYSTLYLPATNIYLKSNLNTSPRYLYRFLQNKITTKYIDTDKDSPQANTPISTINNHIQYKPVSFSSDEDTIDNMGAFIKNVVPTITDKLDYIKDMNPAPLSIYSSILALESFLVYADTINNDMVKKLQQIINSNIDKVQTSYINHLTYLDNAYNYTASPEKHEMDKSVFKDIIDGVEDISDYKFLKTMLSMDGCTLYTLLLVKSNLDLHITKDVAAYATPTEEIPEDLSQKDDKVNCKKYEIAKQYTSRGDLEADNKDPIYYDTHLDPTRYDTMDVYKSQLDAVSTDKEKETFLIQILQQTVGMSVDQAKEEAISLLQRRRLVPEGVFALLTIDNTYTYYKRIANEWEEDVSIPKIPLESNTIFCNMQPKCLTLKSECETINNIKIPSYMDKMKAFDSAIEKELELFKQTIDKDITYYTDYYNRLVYIQSIKNLKNNNMYYSLGLESGTTPPTPSPYLELMTAIIGQSDFVKRQHDIVKFVTIYTRPAEEEENPFFRYCKKSNNPLMPLFLMDLASTWITTPAKYIPTLESICVKQGKLSDDGDCWVDEHSGYVIKIIESVSEFQSTGAEVVLTNELFIAPKKRVVLSTTLDMVVYAIANKLGINIETQIVDMKTIYNKLINNRKFLKTSDEFKRLKKSTDPEKANKQYEKYKNMLWVRAAIATFVCVIQTAIPNYNSKTTTPGCVKDFSGYPLGSQENMGCVKYIICIIKSLITTFEPWKHIHVYRKNIDTFKSHLVKDISKITETDAYQLLKRKKLAYNVQNPIDDTLVSRGTNWHQFLPPLSPINQRSVEPCNTKVLENLHSDLLMGSKDQYDKINIINGKIQLFSISVLKTISTAISKNAALLSNSFNEPFIENSCCLEQQNTGILIYLFGPSLTKIIDEINYIKTYEVMLSDVLYLSKAPVLLCLENTILNWATTIPDYSESIIILAIINYCNYDNFKLVPDNLISICGDKPEKYNSLDTFANKASIIKAERGQLNNELLFSMLKVVYKKLETAHTSDILYGHSYVLENYVTSFANKHNTPPVNEIVNLYLESNIEILEEYTKAKEENNTAIQMKVEDAAVRYYTAQPNHIDSQVVITNKLLYDILETINQPDYSKPTIDLVDKMDAFNQVSVNRIKEIIKDQSITPPLRELFNIKKPKKAIPFIDELLYWKDNNISNNISWLQYVIYNLTTILPNKIIHKHKYDKIKIPKYWNLHPDHESKIKQMVLSEFNSFRTFMNKDYLDIWFNSIKASLDYYLALSKSIIIRETGMFDAISSKKLLEYCVFEICNLYIGGEEGVTEDPGYRDRVLFIATAMKMFSDTKKKINWSYDEIVYDVNKSKESEKELVINRLESMSDEEKQLDKEMKNLKLGPWAIDHVTNYNAAEWAKTDNDADYAALVAETEEHDNIADYQGENADE